MRLRTHVALVCAAVGALLATGTAKAAPVTFSVVSSASSIKLNLPSSLFVKLTSDTTISVIGGTSLPVTVRLLNPATSTNQSGSATANGVNGPWTIGNSQRLNGAFVVDTDFVSSIEFLSSNAVAIGGIDQAAAYFPNATGLGNTPAQSSDLAARIFANIGTSLGNVGENVDLAFRDVLYSITNGPVAIDGGGNFNSAGADITLADGDLAARARVGTSGFLAGLAAGAVADALNGALADLATGSGGSGQLIPLGELGFGGANAAAGGSISLSGPPGNVVATLTVPVNIPFSFEIGLGVVLNGSFTGTVVATAVVPEPSTYALMATGLATCCSAVALRRRKRA